VSGFTVVNATGEGILVSTTSNVTLRRNAVRNNDRRRTRTHAGVRAPGRGAR
jgi:parallel beta-helix repeat protein